jgi:hypothetical protein
MRLNETRVITELTIPPYCLFTFGFGVSNIIINTNDSGFKIPDILLCGSYPRKLSQNKKNLQANPVTVAKT